MSVINRMLSDLERRGAPASRAGEQAMPAATPQRRRRRMSARVVLVAVALVLFALAAALWAQRGERIVAMLAPTAAPAPAVPELVGVSFDHLGDRPRFKLSVSGEMKRAPRFSRSGGRATLVLDAVAGDLVLPAPPRDQDVFEGISLDSDASPRTHIRVAIAAAAELEFNAEGGEIALVGALPAAASATPEGGDDKPAVAADGSAEAMAANTPDATDEANEKPAAGNAETVAETPAPEAETPVTEPESTDDAAVARVPAEKNTEQAGSGSPASSTPAAQADQPSGGQATGEAMASGTTVRKSASMPPEARARRRYREGRDAVARGELASARRALNEALDLDPSLHAARELLVGLLRRAGETAAARRLLAEGVERAPARLQFAMPYARLLVDVDELDRAAGVLEGARANGAGSSGYHALVAAVEQRRGGHRAAASAYTRALEIRPDNGLWWLGLGISLAALEKPAEARAAFREARASGTLGESLDRWARGRIDELTGNEG